MVIFKLLIGMILVFILVAFAIANMQGVAVSFYFYHTPQIPLFVVIFLSLLLGVIVAWGLAVSEQLRLRGQVRARNKEVRRLQAEIEALEGRLSRLSPPHVEEASPPEEAAPKEVAEIPLVEETEQPQEEKGQGE